MFKHILSESAVLFIQGVFMHQSPDTKLAPLKLHLHKHLTTNNVGLRI